MIECSDGYKKAIVADTRRILFRAIIDIISPDIVYGSGNASSEFQYSSLEQLHDKNFENPPKNITLEQNRWVLDGSWNTFPDDVSSLNLGYVSENLSDENGTINEWVELQFSNVSVLQACSVFFLENDYDGIPENFKIEVKQGGTAYYTKEFTGNKSSKISLEGFTVNNPDAIRVTVTKMSLPSRRFRSVEIVPGIYEIWDGNSIAEFSLKHQGDVSCTSLPYGTCTIQMDNLDRRFEPRNKTGIFRSIEEKQGIDVSLAVRLEDGTDEYKKLGKFYQFSGGWKTGDNGLTMTWDLVDIIGLLSDREFIPPNTLPTTLEGWIASIVLQLGENFANLYIIDEAYAGMPLTVREKSDVEGQKCGDIIRYACMATGTWPRADADTGFLAVEPLWNNGTKITLDNLESYPTLSANKDIAAIIFQLNDSAKTQYVVSGTSTASSNTVSISNPFIKTQEQALAAAKLILSTYGGNKIETTGRGDMASEIGDVDTIWLDESNAATARRIEQDLSFSSGVLQKCKSVLLQADGSFLYQNSEVIKESCTWTAPDGVSSLRIILVGKGNDGEQGTAGNFSSAGTKGADGAGGKVFVSTISINNQQSFAVDIGENTVFGAYSSANGSYFQYGYTDIASGNSYARTGVQMPINGSGDGGAGGAGGKKGNAHTETDENGNSYEVIDNRPGKGKKGATGALGCAIVYWEKQVTA